MVIPEGLVNMFFLRHPRRFLSGICRYVREQERQKQISEPCGPPNTRGGRQKAKDSYEH